MGGKREAVAEGSAEAKGKKPVLAKGGRGWGKTAKRKVRERRSWGERGEASERQRAEVREAQQGQGTGRANRRPQGPERSTRPPPGSTRPAALRPGRQRRLTQRLQGPRCRTWGPVQTHRRTKRVEETAALAWSGSASLENGSHRPGSPHNPHLVPPEAFGRMCQASRGGAEKRLGPAHCPTHLPPSPPPRAPPPAPASPAPGYASLGASQVPGADGLVFAVLRLRCPREKHFSTQFSRRSLKMRVIPASLKRAWGEMHLVDLGKPWKKCGKFLKTLVGRLTQGDVFIPDISL